MSNTRPRLNFKTSEFGRKLVVRSGQDINEHERACTPFCEVTDVVRNEDRCYVTLHIDPRSAFHAYLTSVNNQIASFLGTQRPVRLPYDHEQHLLRIKFPIRGNRLAVRTFQASSLEEIPPSTVQRGRTVATSMALHDIWLDSDVIYPTWVADKAIVRAS